MIHDGIEVEDIFPETDAMLDAAHDEYPRQVLAQPADVDATLDACVSNGTWRSRAPRMSGPSARHSPPMTGRRFRTLL